MPRNTAYVPWSSRNAIFLKNQPGYSDNDKDVDWRNKGKMNKERVERHSRKGVEGRAHREEAFLMQMVGVQNDTECLKCIRNNGAFISCKSVGGLVRGACANCHWDSNGVNCSLEVVRNALRVEVECREDTQQLKRRRVNVSGNVSSKKQCKNKAGADVASAEVAEEEIVAERAVTDEKVPVSATSVEPPASSPSPVYGFVSVPLLLLPRANPTKAPGVKRKRDAIKSEEDVVDRNPTAEPKAETGSPPRKMVKVDEGELAELREIARRAKEMNQRMREAVIIED